MSRQRRTSSVSDEAKIRLAGLKSIDPALDLGGDLNVPGFDTEIKDVDKDTSTYNQMLSDVDAFQNRLDARVEKLNDKSVRFLSAVGGRWGKDSDEYEKAGGTRISDRKKSGPRNKGNKPGA